MVVTIVDTDAVVGTVLLDYCLRDFADLVKDNPERGGEFYEESVFGVMVHDDVEAMGDSFSEFCDMGVAAIACDGTEIVVDFPSVGYVGVLCVHLSNNPGLFLIVRCMGDNGFQLLDTDI
jgi:hypothetical protein